MRPKCGCAPVSARGRAAPTTRGGRRGAVGWGVAEGSAPGEAGPARAARGAPAQQQSLAGPRAGGHGGCEQTQAGAGSARPAPPAPLGPPGGAQPPDHGVWARGLAARRASVAGRGMQTDRFRAGGGEGTRITPPSGVELERRYCQESSRGVIPAAREVLPEHGAARRTDSLQDGILAGAPHHSTLRWSLGQSRSAAVAPGCACAGAGARASRT
eukprot:gene15831-biopygen3269